MNQNKIKTYNIMTKKEIKNEIIRLIEFYKDEAEEYKDFLENSMEDGETNSAAEASLDRIEEFLNNLERLKSYCDEE
jgi:hypothetical protein